MNTTAEADAIATATASATLDSALSQLKRTIDTAAKSAYDDLAARLTADIRADVTNYVTERVGDHAQFGYHFPDVSSNPLPVISGVKYLANEVPFVWHQPNALLPAHIITNYGRYIVNGIQHRPAYQRLTRDIMECVRALVNDMPYAYKPYSGAIKALNAVDTISSNTVHINRVSACNAAAKAEFDAERAEMTASNKRLRDECAEEIAARQREVDERQAELNERQAELNARQAELDARQITLDARQTDLDAKGADERARTAFHEQIAEFQAKLDAAKAMFGGAA